MPCLVFQMNPQPRAVRLLWRANTWLGASSETDAGSGRIEPGIPSHVRSRVSQTTKPDVHLDVNI